MATSPVAPELLTNPGFEQVGEKGLPLGWQRYGGIVPESQVELVPEAHSGKWALRLLDTGPKERNYRWATGVYQDLPATPGRYYRASVWVKARARNHPQAVILQLTFLPQSLSRAAFLTPPLGGNWQRFALVAQAPEGAEQVRLYLYTMHYWTSDTLLDEASLREVDLATLGPQALPLFWGSEGIGRLRPRSGEVPLVKKGQPRAVIVHPSGPEYAASARQLQTFVRERTGAELPLVNAAALNRRNWRNFVQDPAGLGPTTSLVVLGNLLNNVLLERLYWNKYALADRAFPGPGGYTLRTVSEPYGFAAGQNVLVVGASDLAGLRRGVAALTDLLASTNPLADLTVPYTLRVEPHPPLPPNLPETPPTDFTAFIKYGQQYLRTGEGKYAELARKALLQCAARYRENPDYSVTWPEETSSVHIGLVWDAIEPSPVFSAEDRLTCVNALLTLLYELPRHTSSWGRLRDNNTIIWNHTTFPLLGIYTLARYFRRFYGNLDGRLDDYLAEVHGAFRGQMRCWKPQCDADGYLTLTINHTLTYALAEGDYTFGENGNLQRFADYLTALCDNRGLHPGLGDSGYARSPGYELRGLPLAFWWTRDGRYLWRLQQCNPNWVNPYWGDIEPRPWRELVGVKVTPLPPLVYDFTRTRSYYGEPVTPPNIPFAQSFDKITFRENLEPEGQFLLLDGYASGKHLHYDGNAIIKCAMLGEDFLIDADYLVRNTTEHSMVSIIRNGRAKQLEPVCTALLHHADLPTFGFTQTQVHDWNGADWMRSILWWKGEGFVVFDTVTARMEGDFTAECVWKTLNRGTQTLSPQEFRTLIVAGDGIGNRDLRVVAHEGASGGKAVKFTQSTARLDFGLELPAGQYTLTLYALGLDSGTDSFWLSIDGGKERTAYHIPVGHFGPSSGSWTKETPTPGFTLERGGFHRLTLTLRENPGVLLDRLVLTTAEGQEVAAFEAEEAPELPAEMQRAAPKKSFVIAFDGSARAKMTTRFSNVGLPVRKLHQRQRRHLRPGEALTFVNLLYAETEAAPRGYTLRRLGPREVLLLASDGTPLAYVGTGQTEATRTVLPVEAPLFWIGRDRFAVAEGTRVGDFWQQAQPTDHEARVEGDLLPRALARLSQLPTYAPPPSPARPGLSAPPLEAQWSFLDPEGQPVAALSAADLDDDGRPEILVAQGPMVRCLGADGQVRWAVAAEGSVRAMATGDLDGDGRPEVLFGDEEEYVTLLSAAGRVRTRYQVEAPLRVGTSSIRQPRVRTILVGDADHDGQTDVFVGVANGNLIRYTPTWEQVWRFDRIEHGTREGQLVDLDGDGQLEIVVGNKYGSVEIFEAGGRQVDNIYSELGDVEFDLGDVDGDGKMEIVNGSSTGALRVEEFRGDKEWTFDNYGYAARDVRCADVNGDGQPEVLVASETGYLYFLDGQGQVRAQVDLGEALRVLAVADVDGDGAVEVVTGGDDGAVTVLDGQGRVERRQALDAYVVGLWVVPGGGEGPLILAATEKGALWAYRAR